MGAIRPFLARWRWWVTVRAERTTSIDREPWLSCQRAVAWLEAQSWPSAEQFCATLSELEAGTCRVPGTAPPNVAALARSMRLTWEYEALGSPGQTGNASFHVAGRTDVVSRADQAARAAHTPRTWRSTPRRPR